MQLDVSSVKEGKFSENATSKTIQINAWAHTSERRIPLISKCGAQKLEGTGNTWWMKLIPPRKKKNIYIYPKGYIESFDPQIKYRRTQLVIYTISYGRIYVGVYLGI